MNVISDTIKVYSELNLRYRTITPKARLVPLDDAFLAYLRADGIILPPDDNEPASWSDSDSGIFSSTDNVSEASDSTEADNDPSAAWREIHESVKATITDLGGKVVPKLNWSAPKDATWINPTNSMECRSPGDIYLMLKSSDFVTHDLEHAFDDTIDELHDSSTQSNAHTPTDGEVGAEASTTPTTSSQLGRYKIDYHLVLRKYFQLNPSLEFRCFVRGRKLLAMCQRDLNHFEFLFGMQDKLRESIQTFFDEKLKDSFPDPNFVFDVYVPPPHDKVWLIDINPWAQRTDPLLFSWLELLTMAEPPDPHREKTVRIPLPLQSPSHTSPPALQDTPSQAAHTAPNPPDSPVPILSDSDSDSADEELFLPEVRLVRKDDPEAYSFTTPQYSAHKLPRDVVDASRAGGSELREFAQQWKEVLARRQAEDEEGSEEE